MTSPAAYTPAQLAGAFEIPESEVLAAINQGRLVADRAGAFVVVHRAVAVKFAAQWHQIAADKAGRHPLLALAESRAAAASGHESFQQHAGEHALVSLARRRAETARRGR